MVEEEKKNLLIIDDEENMRHMLKTLLDKSGYQVNTAGNGIEALEIVRSKVYDFILCDLKMPEMDGMTFLKSAGGLLDQTTVIMMSAYGTIESAIEAMKLGAYDYISKPFKTDEVCLTLKKAEERKRLKNENVVLKEKIKSIEDDYRFGNMIAKSKVMKSIFLLSRKVAQYDTTVLIYGESGTGKELVARGIHLESKRSEGPWVAVNCGEIPENLLESEFFGYKKGAFTGAVVDRKGLFQEADGGTIFLDEISELPFFLQVKLLRVLQEREIRPIGESKTRKINIRVIAATSKDLSDEVKSGRFRQDLFFRMNVIQVKLPPLRERKDDIAMLSLFFMKNFNNELGKSITKISPAAMALFLEYSWPGNVRELKNCIERAMILSENDILLPRHFPVEIRQPDKQGGLNNVFEELSLKNAQKKLEKTLITKALEETGGNRTKASRLLEISHPSLLNKIKNYKINV